MVHPDFTHEEVEEVCELYLSSITEKIKEETKLKRLVKYIEKEFELESSEIRKTSRKTYGLDQIPEYLFNGKAEIASSLVTITNLTKNIEQTELFLNAEMKINRRDKIALIGKNGAGKTTLLKMVIGKEGDFDGRIEKAANLKIGYLSQDLFWQDTRNTLRTEMLMVFPEITEKMDRLTFLESRIKSHDAQHEHISSPLLQRRGVGGEAEESESLADWEEADRIKAYLRENDGYAKYNLQLDILKYFGFSDEQMDFNVLQLSGGEQTKVQIAKFLITEVDLLILDEPTNHLDIEGIIFLEHFCKIWKKAILAISHDVRFINNTSDKIVEISEKKLHNYPGNYEKYLLEKQSKYDRQLRDYETQQKELEKQEAYINRFRYQASKAAGVQSRIKQVDKIERIERPENESVVRNIIIKTDKRLPEKIMEFTDLSVGYGAPIIATLGELVVRKDDKIGIIGRNGAGKTTLLKTILGELSALSGTVKINPDLIIGSYSQVLADLDPEASILAELSKNHSKENEIRSMLGGLLITGDKVEQRIKTLSG